MLAERFPSELTAVFLDDGDGQRLGYQEAHIATARLQAFLKARGVGPGDRVAALVEKSFQAVLLYLACLRMGAIFVPLSTAYRDEEVVCFLGDVRPRVFVCDPARVVSLTATAERAGVQHMLTLDAQGKGSLAVYTKLFPDDSIVRQSADDAAVILYTSGTTGQPKGAILTHGNLVANAKTLHAAWGWRPDDVLLHALPLTHAHGLFISLHTAMLGGSRIIFLPRFGAHRVTPLLPRATVFMGVPTYYTELLRQGAFGLDACTGIRLFICGSAPLLPETWALFKARSGGFEILERYGATEMVIPFSNRLDGERRPGALFPLPGTTMRIVDLETGAIITDETPGMLEVQGSSVFPGYWKNPEATNAVFHDGFYVTGDIATMGADGSIAIVGRGKDMISTGGEKVFPIDVETAINAVPGVAESAVVGLPHARWGEAVTAFVVCAAGVTLNPATVLAALTGLADFKRPKRVIFVQALPRNAMGKVQKQELRTTYKALYDGE